MAVNLLPDPSFAGGDTWWAGPYRQGLVDDTLHPSPAGDGLFGEHAGLVYAEGADAGAVVLTSSLVPVTPQTPYTASAYVRSPGPGVVTGLTLTWFGEGENDQIAEQGVESVTGTDWLRLSVRDVAPIAAQYAAVTIYVEPEAGYDPGNPDASAYLLDGAMLLDELSDREFFYGDTPDAGGTIYAWTGVPHASPSTATPAPVVVPPVVVPPPVGVSVRAVDRTARTAVRALGWGEDVLDSGPNDHVVWAAAATAWGLIEGATRGRGCPVDLLPVTDPPTPQEAAAIAAAGRAPADLAAVALAATMRLAPNPAQRVSESVTTEAGTRRVEGSFQGFTLAENLVLNRYRRRVR